MWPFDIDRADVTRGRVTGGRVVRILAAGDREIDALVDPSCHPVGDNDTGTNRLAQVVR